MGNKGLNAQTLMRGQGAGKVREEGRGKVR